MIRWSLYDPVADETLTFVRNPKSMTSMAQGHSTKSMAASPVTGVIRSFRAPDKPFVWSFTGRVRTQAEYDALLSWVSRPNRLHLSDHFGRTHQVLGQHFTPTPVEKNGTGNPWLFDYAIDVLYLRRLA